MTPPSTRPDARGVLWKDDGTAVPPRTPDGRIYPLGVWWLALGYGVCYVPYVALVKATSKGLLPGLAAPASPVEMLPAIGFATAVTTALIVTTLGWWPYCGRRTVWGVSLPWPSRCTLIGGCATAAIIYTTTLMYTFSGVSIVLALLVMRGGVLLLAPAVDLVFARRVRWFTWAALGLSVSALAAAAAEVPSYELGWGLVLTAGTYIAGYAVRLRCANTVAKGPRQDATYRYFVEEQLVAMTALVAIPVVLALAGESGPASAIRHGFTSFPATRALWPALLIGAAYAALYTFGTLVYLDRRENTFCVCLNRCSSLVAGIIASYGLSLLFGAGSPNAGEIAGVVLILTAIVVLSPVHHVLERVPSTPALPVEPVAPPYVLSAQATPQESGRVWR